MVIYLPVYIAYCDHKYFDMNEENNISRKKSNTIKHRASSSSENQFVSHIQIISISLFKFISISKYFVTAMIQLHYYFIILSSKLGDVILSTHSQSTNHTTWSNSIPRNRPMRIQHLETEWRHMRTRRDFRLKWIVWYN